MDASSESNALVKDDGAPIPHTDDARHNNRQSTFFSLRSFETNAFPREIDVFGFLLEPKHFLILLVLITMMLGSGGSK